MSFLSEWHVAPTYVYVHTLGVEDLHSRTYRTACTHSLAACVCIYVAAAKRIMNGLGPVFIYLVGFPHAGSLWAFCMLVLLRGLVSTHLTDALIFAPLASHLWEFMI